MNVLRMARTENTSAQPNEETLSMFLKMLHDIQII